MEFFVYVVAYDAWFYAAHRVLHIPWVYKRYHWQHHVHTHPEWGDTFTAHAVENAVSGLGILAPYLGGGCSGMGLLAAWAFCLARGVARHDARCAWLVGTHHLRHHTMKGKNFSSYYMDWLCGTVG